MESLHRIGQQWSEQLSKSPKPEQLEAGIHRLEFAGHMATVDALAKGDPLKYDDVLKLSISTALFKLTYDKTVQEYQDRLYEVMRKRSKK